MLGIYFRGYCRAPRSLASHKRRTVESLLSGVRTEARKRALRDLLEELEPTRSSTAHPSEEKRPKAETEPKEAADCLVEGAQRTFRMWVVCFL
jgi:hypothetical protein